MPPVSTVCHYTRNKERWRRDSSRELTLCGMVEVEVACFMGGEGVEGRDRITKARVISGVAELIVVISQNWRMP